MGKQAKREYVAEVEQNILSLLEADCSSRFCQFGTGCEKGPGSVDLEFTSYLFCISEGRGKF